MQDPDNYDKYVIFKDDDDTVIPELLQKMSLAQGDSVLDFGCGTGETTRHCFQHLAEQKQLRIYGLDISSTVIDYARTHNSHPRITYFVADLIRDGVNGLPLPQFDNIFSYYALYWVPEYRQCMKLLFDALKPGGRFALGNNTYSSNFTVFERILKDPEWGPYVQGTEFNIAPWYKEGDMTDQSFKRAILDAGFEIQYYECIRRVDPGSTLENMTDFYCSIHPAVPRIPEQLRPKFRSTVLKHMTDLSLNPNPMPPLESEVVFAVLVKPTAAA